MSRSKCASMSAISIERQRLRIVVDDEHADVAEVAAPSRGAIGLQLRSVVFTVS